MNEIELKNYLIFFKKNIVDLRNQDLYDKIDEFFDRSIFLKNIEFLEKNSLIIEDNQQNSIYFITEKGEKYLEKIIKNIEYESEKEQIEFEKSKIDLNLAQKMLKEYIYTKWFSRIGFAIALILAVLEIIKWKNN